MWYLEFRKWGLASATSAITSLMAEIDLILNIHILEVGLVVRGVEWSLGMGIRSALTLYGDVTSESRTPQSLQAPPVRFHNMGGRGTSLTYWL